MQLRGIACDIWRYGIGRAIAHRSIVCTEINAFHTIVGHITRVIYFRVCIHTPRQPVHTVQCFGTAPAKWHIAIGIPFEGVGYRQLGGGSTLGLHFGHRPGAIVVHATHSPDLDSVDRRADKVVDGNKGVNNALYKAVAHHDFPFVLVRAVRPVESKAASGGNIQSKGSGSKAELIVAEEEIGLGKEIYHTAGTHIAVVRSAGRGYTLGRRCAVASACGLDI